jgi:hypothetical protein
MGLNWKMMGPLRQRLGPIWLSSIPKMSPWVPIQLSIAKMTFALGQNSFGPKRAETEFGVVLALFNLRCIFIIKQQVSTI